MKMASRSTLLVTWVASLKFYQTTASPLDSVKVVDAHTKIDLYEDFSAKHGWHHTRRTAKTRSLQYGEKSGRSHPFEKYSSENLVKSSHQKSTQQRRQQEISDGSNLGPAPTPATIYVNYKPYGASSPTPAVVEPDYSSYEPIRIKVDSRRLEPLVESDPDKYADLVDHLVTRAMPRATNFWSTHLSTVPVKGNITVYPEECSQPFNNDDAAYHTFDEADLVLYLILDEGPCLGKSPPIAFSNDCVMDQFDRPVAVS